MLNKQSYTIKYEQNNTMRNLPLSTHIPTTVNQPSQLKVFKAQETKPYIEHWKLCKFDIEKLLLNTKEEFQNWSLCYVFEHQKPLQP